jgi:hypothetical protein
MMHLARIITISVFCSLLPTAFAQQNGGERELGIGGSVSLSHAASPTGNANFQFSLGKYFTRRNYLQLNLLPNVTFGSDSTSVGGFFGTGYRYLFAAENRRVFPFVGLGGGTYLFSGSGRTSTAGSGYGEAGVKAYFSPRTSFDISYSFLYTGTGLGATRSGFSFAENTRSQVILSVRHLF